jgi:hypothetical protein
MCGGVAMNREERRQKGIKQKVRTYTLTETQLNEIKRECTNTAVDYAFMYLVGMSIRVLHDQFGFGLKVRLPKFADAIIDEYERYLSGDMTPEQYRDLIYDQCGVKFVLTDQMDSQLLVK